MDTERYTDKRSGSRLTLGAHIFGVLSIILMIIWLLHYRGGIEYGSDNSSRVFNVHPFLMFCGFVFLAGEAMMAYKTVPAERDVQKFVHMFLHLTALILGVVGLCAVFKFHNMVKVSDMQSIHSWIGLGTICLFCLQWIVGLRVFMFSGASSDARSMMRPWHMSGGRIILYMSICTALTGLMQKQISSSPGIGESILINFTGLAILFFGIFVDLSVALGRYV